MTCFKAALPDMHSAFLHNSFVKGDEGAVTLFKAVVLTQICVETPELITLECKAPPLFVNPAGLGFTKAERTSNVCPWELLVNGFLSK